MSGQYTIDNIKDRYLAMTDEITRLRAENEKLRKALKPFADNYQDNGLSHAMHIFEMKYLLAAKKVLEA